MKGEATQEMKDMLEDLELDFSIGLTSAQKVLDAALDRTEAAAAEEAAAVKEAAAQEQADALARAEAAADEEWDALCVSQRLTESAPSERGRGGSSLDSQNHRQARRAASREAGCFVASG